MLLKEVVTVRRKWLRLALSKSRNSLCNLTPDNGHLFSYQHVAFWKNQDY